MVDPRIPIIEAYIQAYNTFDVPCMIQHLAETVVFENITQGEVSLRTEGKAAFTEQAKAATAYFKERTQTITNWDIQPDEINIELAYQAILAVDLPNGMKAGESLNLTGQSVFRFQGGQISLIKDLS